METTLNIELLDGVKIVMNDLTVGQAMDIAQISPQLNEARLSAMIAHISGDISLASKLTAQERYYFLINYQTIADDIYSSGSKDGGKFFIETIQKDVPRTVVIGDMTINHLYGSHVCVLDTMCEDISDWALGKIACQLSGDLRSLLGGDDDEWVWDALPIEATSAEISQAIQQRVTMLNDVPVNSFNMLADCFDAGVMQLEHFVMLGCDNGGLTVLPTTGGTDSEPARFHALDSLCGTVEQLARYITTRRFHDDGTRQDELA